MIELRFEIGGFFDERARNIRVADRSGQFEKCCRPPREIVPADHDPPPLISRIGDAQTGGSFPELY